MLMNNSISQKPPTAWQIIHDQWPTLTEEEKEHVVKATWFGSGLIPPPKFMNGMAGTYGSLFTLPLCVPLVYLGRYTFQTFPTPNHDLILQFAGIIIYALIVILISQHGKDSVPDTEKILGPLTDWKGKTKDHDQNQIVIDEVLGMLVTCYPLLWTTYYSDWWAFGLAFGYFRIFDIVKVWPTKIFDQIKTPFGVMFDDVIAGIYAAICLVITIKIFNL